MKVNVFLFEDFEILDAFGPVEVFHYADGMEVGFYSSEGGIVKSVQGPRVVTEPIASADPHAAFLIPGGIGTNGVIGDDAGLGLVRAAAESASWVMSVCTGSRVLAAAGVLDGRRATSNKLFFDSVTPYGPGVEWERSARWVVDGKFYTASGVSAGIDMALGFVADRYGQEEAERIAGFIEHSWSRDPDDDPFARIN